MRKAICLLLWGWLGSTISIQAAGLKGSGPVEIKPAPKPTAEQLIERLGDRRYRVRQAAYLDLARMDDAVLPLLLKARKTKTDLEILRRLDGLIPSMEMSAMLKPRPVSLRADKRPIRDVLAEVTRQTGYPIDLDNNGNNEVFSFHFDKVPFWQALDRICKDAKLTIYPYYYGNGNDRLRLNAYGTPPGPYVKYHETFRYVVTGFNYQRNVNFTGSHTEKMVPPQRTEYLSMNFTLHAEPKLPFLQVDTPIVTEAYDENHKPMAPQVVSTSSYHSERSRSKYGSGARFFYNSMSLSLVRPSRDSKTAKLVRGEIPVLLLSKQLPEITIDTPLTVKKKKFKGKITEIEVERIAEANNWGNGKTYQVFMSVKEDTDTKQNDYSWAQTLQYRLELSDAKGNKYMIWSNSLYNRAPKLAQGSITFRPPDNVQIGPPVKLVFNQWVPVHHRIKFEFKNMPLP